jgi:NTE family protein
MGILSFLRGHLARPDGIVLALGGGGARGLAHVGVLEVIEEAGVPVAGIAGTSAGAVVGAMWLTLGSAAAVAQRWKEFLAAGLMPHLPDIRLTNTVTSHDNLLLQFARRLKRSAVVALALERTSLVTHGEFEKRLAFLFPDCRIQKLRLPFAAVATDFETGRPVALRRGQLLPAVAASCAVPAVVLPYVIEGHALLDGGTVADVPVAQARALAPRPVVAVEVGEGWPDDDPRAITLPRAMMRGASMTHEALRELQLRQADLVISPDVGTLHWSEFARYEEAVAAGRAAAQTSVHRLRALSFRTPAPAERKSAGAWGAARP